VNFRIRVPATTSNLGPGFDCFGMALTLYLDVEVRQADKLRVSAEGADVPLDRTNLVVRTFLDALGDVPEPNLAIHMVNRIPLARGLGSSAAARIAGLALAQAVLHRVEGFDRAHIARRACELEGHPDNATPAVFGGFCAAGAGLPHERVEMNDRRYLLVIPELEIRTEQARDSLPKQVPHPDAAFNLQRAAIGAARICRMRDLAALAPFEDRLHQRHRLALDGRLLEAFEALRRSPAVEALFLSGSGPTLFCLSDQYDDARSTARSVFDKLGLDIRTIEISADNRGLELLPLLDA
jgi:homoserine kinase